MLDRNQNKMKIEESHAKVPETKDTTVDNDCVVVKFNNIFTHLGSITNFLLDECS